jgi:hypothetical protein
MLDGVLVMRVTGGRVTSVLDGIVALDTLVEFKDILVIHHIGKLFLLSNV